MFSSSFHLRSMLLAMLFAFCSVAGFAQTIYVDDDAPNDLGVGTVGDPKQFIQSGIDLAASGETVIVADGTYNESVIIDRALTLRGPNFGVAGNGTRVTEANIESVGGTAITVTSDDVTIEGFQIGVTTTVTGVETDDMTNIIIRNNIVITNGIGLDLSNTTGITTGSVAVTDNLIDMIAIRIGATANGSAGIAITNSLGSADIDITNNDIADASIGIAAFGLTATPTALFDDGSITASTTGVLVSNIDDAANGSASIVDITNITMSGFATDATVGGTETGVYAFTSSLANADDDLIVNMTNLDISGTGNDASNYAGIVIGDFFIGTPDTDDGIGITATITNSNIHDNENRGILTRGPNAVTNITQSSIVDNGFDPTGSGGNDGFSIIARDTSITTVTNCFISNRSTQDNFETDGLSESTSGSLTVTNSHLTSNGNGTIASTGGVNLSNNYFSTTDESGILALVGSGNDFTPWIASGTDTDGGTAGFQPDLDSLYVGTSGTQTGATGRIDEAIGLVDASGSIIINAGTYTETLTVNKAVNLLGSNVDIPSSSPRIAETIINPGSLETALNIASNSVTIDGIQVGASNVSSNANIGIAAFGFTNADISNNIIYADSTGLQVGVGTTGTINVDNNSIEMLGVVNSNSYASIAMSVANLSSTIDLNIENNDVLNASFGIVGYGLTSDNVLSITGGSFSGCTQGIVITNTDGAGSFSRSIAEIEDVTMSSFVDPGGGLVVPDAQAGIYVGTFSDGSTTTVNDSIEVTINNVTITGTGNTGTDYAAINVVDFGGSSPFITDDGIGVNVTVTTSDLSDNLNRGFTLRGVNATATIDRNTFSGNSNAAIVVSRLGFVELNNNFIINPGSGTPRALVAQTDGTMTARDNSIDAGNGTLADGQDADDKIDLSRNYLGATVEATISGLVDNANSDFSPWIASGTDTNPSFAGFQPDLSTLHVGTSGDQTSGDRIQEGHDLVDTLGTVIINTADYDETLTVTKDISIDPAASTTIDNITTNGGSLSILADLEIENTLTLTDGVVDIDLDDGTKTDDPTLTVNNAVAGTFSDDNHIEGKLVYQLSSGTFDFPVGDEGDYRPVVIAPTNFPSSFEVAHVAAAPSNIASLQSLIGTGSPVIQSVLEDRHWGINTSDSPGSTDVTLQVSASDMEIEPGVLSMVRDNAGTWEEQSSPMEVGSDPVDVTATATDFGDFSLISAFGMAPGNVSTGLRTWLKADAGTSTTTDNTDITLWSDMNGVGADAAGTTNFPLFRDNASFNFNFNPVIVTDGVNDTLATILDPIADSDDFTLFMVADNENMVTRGATGAGDGWSIKSFSSVTTTSGGVIQENVTGLPATSNPTIHTLSFDQGNSLNGYRNGTAGAPDVSVGTDLQNSTDSLNIGIDDTNFESGSIAELIMYNTVFAGTERERIESYLAIKYGITMPVDYLAADGGTIWNTTTNAGYNNDIAGIGRDDFSGLDQRKSKSLNDSSLVAIALADFDTPSAFADNDAWLIWGSDGADSTLTSSIDNAHSGTSPRMTRIWRVQETGTVGSIEISLESTASTETVSLIVHPSDDAFPNDGSRQVYEMVYSSTTDDYRVTVDLTNGDYFTFAEGPVGGIPAVLISEVITDPQQDWSADGFHNPEPDVLSTASQNEWVELFITENNLDLTNWSIELIDGGTINGSLSSGDIFDIVNYNSLSGGLFQATDSGDFVILGDPDNVLANTQHVILRNGAGEVVDQVIIEDDSRGTGFDGNSTGVEDESVTRLFTDTDTNYDSVDFVLTKASLGFIDSLTGVVVINEVVIDPAQDWGSVSFSGDAPGGTGANNDEYIELYIGSSNINLTGWTIEMIDGSDVSGELRTGTGGAFNFANYVSTNGGTFTNTQEGDYLVLGDPVGDMQGGTLVVLTNSGGTEIDRVQLGGAIDGFNSSVDIESVSRYLNAEDTDVDLDDFIETRATPGSTNSPTGIVLINEVVTDPQQQWDTNGFDGTIGDDGSAISGSDEWIELYMADEGINLTGWTLTIEDSNVDVDNGFITSSGPFGHAVYFSQAGGSFTNTAQGDYYVLGDATGDMTDDVLITLRDAAGNVVDEVEIGDDRAGDGNGDGAPDGGSGGGNASGLTDESVARIPNATDTNNDVDDFEATTATLGSANTTAPVATIGNALDFDGDDDFVALPQGGNFPIANSSTFTLEMWVKGVSQEDSVVFSEGNSTDDETRFSLGSGLGGDTDKLRFNIVEDDGTVALDAVTNATVFDGEWHHIALVRGSSSTADIYVDGILDATDFDYTLGTITPDNSSIGALVNTSNTSEFLGQVDELRLWTTARSQVDILENMNSTVDQSDANLLSYYRFDQSSGSSLDDIKGSDNGTLNNMANDDWVTADWPVYAENSTIVQSASGNQTDAASGQLSIINSSFLIDNDDILLVGHEASDFDTVTTELPANTLVANRYTRSWHLTKNDASGTDGGSVTMNFEIGQEPDSALNYSLLERSDLVSDFEVTPIVGYQPGATSVDFTVDVDSLTHDQYYTLGWSDAGPGNALDFDGVDDMVELSAHIASLDFDAPATIEFWYDPPDAFDRTAETGTIFSIGDNGTNDFAIFYGTSAAALTDEVLTVQHLDGTATTSAYENGSFNNDLHHWAVVATGTTYLIYLDGLLVPTTYSIGSGVGFFGDNITATLARIGNRTAHGDEYLEGDLDEFRIWDDERTQQEIIDNMYSNLAGDEANLVSYYRFNEGIGNDPYNLPDLGGSNNNGQLVDFDNLDNTTASSNFITSDRGVFEDNVIIINTSTDILTNSSGELALTSTTSDFLQDDGDFIRWGHDGGDFSEVTTDLPANSNLAARIDKTWNLTKGDAVGTADGLVAFAFDLGTSPDPDYTYYLLQRSGVSGDFSSTQLIGSEPNGNTIEFTVDGSEIINGNYFTLGRSDAGPGHALDLDGSNDYVAVAENALLDISGALTLEAWVNLGALPPTAHEGIISKYASGGDFSYSLEINTAGNVVFNISDNGTSTTTLTSTSTVTTDQWTGITAVYDPSDSMTIYINGIINAQLTAAIPASIFNSSADLWIGATTLINADSLIDASIDEVRVWDDVRSIDEIQNNLHQSLDVASESNLVAYYKFNDGLAANTNAGIDALTDYSGNDLVGVLNGFALAGTSSNWILSGAPQSGNALSSSLLGPGNALDFDGSDDEVTFGDALLDDLSSFTAELWFYPTSYSGATRDTDIRTIIGKGDVDGGNGTFGIYFEGDDNASSNLVITLDNGSSLIDTTLSVTDNNIDLNEWHHIAVTWTSGEAFKVYLDGVRIETSQALPGSLADIADDLLLGNSGDADEDHFFGSIDEVRIWGDVRTEEEIQANRYIELVGDETDLLAYYQFDEYADAGNTTLEDITSGNVDGTLTNMTPASDWVSASGREAFKPVSSGSSWSSTSTWKTGTVPNADDIPIFIFSDLTIDGSFSAGSAIILSGVTVTINADDTLYLNRNLFNYGSITGDGAVTMTGDEFVISGGTISNLLLEGDSTRISAPVTISTLDLDEFGNSILYTDDYNLTINEVLNFGTLSYIASKNQNSTSGYVIKSLSLADGDFTFPLASNGSYTPLTVTNLGSTGNIEARVFDDTYAQGTSGPIITTEKEVNKSWEINGDAGVNVTVTLQWNSTNEDPNYASARSSAYMSKNDYNWWEKVTPDVGVTGSDPYQITASGIQTFSVFGTGTEDSSLPVTWMVFEAFENEDQDIELHWSTATELNNDRFEIEKSFDGHTFQVIGEVAGHGTINSQSEYQFVDTAPFNGINYYRLRQVDYDGTEDYSELVSVFVDVQREYNVKLSPNPTFDITTLNIDWGKDEDYAVGIFDMMGRNLGVVHSKFTRLNLDLSTLPKGIYIIKIHTGDRVIAKKLIKY